MAKIASVHYWPIYVIKIECCNYYQILFFGPGSQPIQQHLTLNLNRPLHNCVGMLRNQDKMEGKSKVSMGIQSQLILPNWIYLSLSLHKL